MAKPEEGGPRRDDRRERPRKRRRGSATSWPPADCCEEENAMAGNIWVVAEHWRGQISDITLRGLALGRELADALGSSWRPCCWDSGGPGGVAGRAEQSSRRSSGAGRPCPRSSPGAGGPARPRGRRPWCWSRSPTSAGAWAGCCRRASAPPVVTSAGTRGWPTERSRSSRVLYGGKMEATVTRERAMVVLGIWPGARRRAGPGRRGAGGGRSDGEPARRAAVRLEYIEPEAGDVDITQQDCLVAVGRGIRARPTSKWPRNWPRRWAARSAGRAR